jgi:hypothetical protein
MHAGLNLVGDALARHVVVRRTAGSLFALGCSLFSILCFTGCASYQLGTGSTPKFATLFIAPVKAEALIPQAEVLVTTQLREAFLRDGRLTLVNSAAAADVVLQVVLTGYGREVAVSRQDDTGLARRFEVTLAAHATLTDTRTQQVLLDHRPLTAQLGVFTDSGLVPAEYQGLPLLAESLAKEAVHTVLDTW